MSRLRVALLGSTGSIGRQALDVAASNPDKIEIVALAANSSADMLAGQAVAFNVHDLALTDAAAAERASVLAGRPVAGGLAAVEAIARRSGADIVLNALVGAVGLRASVATLETGTRLALANKESLVVAGDLIASLGMDRVIPVDSEHSAIFQCLLGEERSPVARLWLTASGGPFRGYSRAQLADVSVEQALAHPRWTMGPKITIDSSTLMNKGLEVIEAHHLFNLDYDRIRVVVHPQSCVHSMVEFVDGSVKAHLGPADMRIPIQYAFSYPGRWESSAEPVDFTKPGRLDFEEPDVSVFRCLALAFHAGRTAGTMPAVMNAANEVAVAAFLGRRVDYLAIERTVEAVMEAHEAGPADSLEAIEAADAWARAEATRRIGTL
jgi:1-deoxy-D-xylulose-5-phosphate reductoisomerase